MRGYLTETRLVAALVAVGLGGVWSSADPPGPGPAAAPTSRSAIELADALVQQVETLAYDDPRLAPTDAFTLPDESLAAAAPGLRSAWRILEHEPARFMKTIEIRVRWSREGRDGEVALTTVKAS